MACDCAVPKNRGETECRAMVDFLALRTIVYNRMNVHHEETPLDDLQPASGQPSIEPGLQPGKTYSIIKGYEGFARDEPLDFDRLNLLYGRYREYMLDENQLIHERSIRGAGAQALIGTALGALLGLEAVGDQLVLVRFSSVLGWQVETLFLCIAAMVSAFGLIAALSTALSVGAAYGSIALLGQQWSAVVRQYLAKRDLAVKADDPCMKADYLPSPVGGGDPGILARWSNAVRMLIWVGFVVWFVLTFSLVVSLFWGGPDITHTPVEVVSPQETTEIPAPAE